MDTGVVILIVVLLFVLGLFAISQLGGGSSTGSVIGTSTYPTAQQQAVGGGCAR